MSMKKTINIPMETTAYYQAISKLNVQFWNQDKNTAELRFLITRNNFPLPLSTENVNIILALESGESFISTADLNIENEVEGVATYTIPPEFMAVATNVTGQIYVGTIDGDEVVVQRKFSFTVANDLLSEIPSEEKIRYIKMFDDLRVDMNNRLDGVTNALSQLEANIDAVNNARETGITAINDLYNAKLITFNQNFDDKMLAITNATTELNDYVDTAQADMIAKKTAFDEAVTGSGLVTTSQSSSWQKHKLIPDSGTLNAYVGIDFNTPEGALGSKTLFGYSANATNSPSGTSGNGYFKYLVRTTDYMKLEYTPFNSNRVFQKTKQAGTWSNWVEIITATDASQIETTTSSQNKANIAENNAKAYTDTKLAATRKTLFSGSVSGKGSNINLTESMDNYAILIVSGSYTGGTFNETILVSTIGTGVPIQRVNLSNTTGSSPNVYEAEISRVNSTRFTILRDNQYSILGDNATMDANNFTIQRIEAIK